MAFDSSRRDKSWSSGTTPVAFSASSKWRKGDRYKTIKKLEEDAQQCTTKIKDLEAEIRDLSASYESLLEKDELCLSLLKDVAGPAVSSETSKVVGLSLGSGGKEESLGSISVEGGEEVEQIAETVDGDGTSGGEVGNPVLEFVASEGEPGGESLELDNDEAKGRLVEETSHEKVLEKSDAKQETWEVDGTIARFNEEHEANQKQILSTKEALEQKRAELEIRIEEQRTLDEEIRKEENLLREIEEEQHQHIAVQNGMRTLSEDLGRMNAVMEKMKDSNADQPKPRNEKPRVYHPVTSLRKQRLLRNLQNGGSLDTARSTTTTGREPQVTANKEPSRTKETTESEERESGNRKRQKSFTAELQRRPQESRSKSDLTTKEKAALSESVTGHSSQRSGPRTGKGAPAAVTSIRLSSRRQLSSPSSVFEGFAESSPPFLGSVRSSISSGSTSASSEMSLELSTPEVVDASMFSSTAKRLDFDSAKVSSSGVVVGSPAGSVDSSMSEEASTGTSFDYQKEIARSSSHGIQIEEVYSEVSSSKKGEVEDFSSKNGIVDKSQPLAEDDVFALDGENVFTEDDEQFLNPNITNPVDINRTLEDPALDNLEEVVKQATEVTDGFSEVYQGFGDSDGASRAAPPLADNTVQDLKIPDWNSDILGDGEVSKKRQESCTSGALDNTSGMVELDVLEDFAEGKIERKSSTTSEFELEDEVDIFEDADAREESVEAGEMRRRSSKLEHPWKQVEVAVGEQTFEDAEKSPFIRDHGSSLKSPRTEFLSVPDPLQEKNVGIPLTDRTNQGRNLRQEAENQMSLLTSQLGSLQREVEVGLELYENLRSDAELDQTTACTEGLGKQVTSFSDEVQGLRRTIDEIQGILSKESGDGSISEHWAKDLQSKCADHSAQLEHLGKQVYILAKDLQQNPQVKTDIDDKLDSQALQISKVEAQLTDFSNALILRVAHIEKEEEDVGELVEQQKHLLVDQLNEARKLRDIAEVRVETLNRQIENLQRVCDVSKNIQALSKYQDKAFKRGLQALIQFVMLAVGVITLYSRIAEPLRGSFVPT